MWCLVETSRINEWATNTYYESAAFGFEVGSFKSLVTTLTIFCVIQKGSCGLPKILRPSLLTWNSSHLSTRTICSRLETDWNEKYIQSEIDVCVRVNIFKFLKERILDSYSANKSPIGSSREQQLAENTIWRGSLFWNGSTLPTDSSSMASYLYFFHGYIE